MQEEGLRGSYGDLCKKIVFLVEEIDELEKFGVV